MPTVSGSVKESLIDRVCDHFSTFIMETKERVERDVSENRLIDFEIPPSTSMRAIYPLGEETHNKGKIPLLIRFDHGKSVIYKPRSMKPERLLCHVEGSVFQKAELGTYRVVCSACDSYGYCELIENKEEENRISTRDELKEYMMRFCLMDSIARRLS